LQKGAADAASFSVAVDGEIVAANVSNLGTAGANALLFDTGAIGGDGPHTLTITKIGAAGQLDIGNARIGYDFAGLHDAIQAYKASAGADFANELYLNALEIYAAPVSTQAEIDMAALLLKTLATGSNASVQKTGKGVATATYGIANKTGAALTVNLILATYDGAGKMKSLTIKPVTVLEELSIEYIEAEIPGGAGGMIKAFIWDTSFIPICADAAYILPPPL